MGDACSAGQTRRTTSDVFPGVQIKGGVCFFLWQRDDRGLCKVSTYSKVNGISVAQRPLLEPGANVFIRYNEAISIIEKVRRRDEKSIMDQISSRRPFGLPTTYKGEDKPFARCVTLYQTAVLVM